MTIGPELKRLLMNVRNLHANIAADVYPDGGMLLCLECSRREPFSSQDAANYLAHGWPMCCGYTMRQNQAE